MRTLKNRVLGWVSEMIGCFWVFVFCILGGPGAPEAFDEEWRP